MNPTSNTNTPHFSPTSHFVHLEAYLAFHHTPTPLQDPSEPGDVETRNPGHDQSPPLLLKTADGITG